jgi:SAM-dependent methyltransferase
MHELLTPSDWVVRWGAIIPPGERVLDVACGTGRHARWLAARGHEVDAVDRDAQALATLAGVKGVHTLCADIEGEPWPYRSGQYAGVVVTNFLHRPLFAELLDALAPNGVLIYETFAVGNERYGRPSNPDFLLRPGELLEIARGRISVLAYEALNVETPRPAALQRMCAIKTGAAST